MYWGIAQAVGLGALQGTTTFLPVSDGGHRALSEMLFDLACPGPTEEIGLLLGALGATLIVVRHACVNLMSAALRAVRRPRTLTTTHSGRELAAVAIAQLPSGILWWWLSEPRNMLGRQPLVIALGLLLSACALLSTAWARRGNRLAPSIAHTLLIGLAQGFAQFPGVSRSGCTIALALWCGLSERRAFEFSMLVSIPVIIASLAKLTASAAGVDGSVIGAVFASGVSLVTGIGAANLVRVAVVRGHLAWFAMWVAPLSIATFAFARAWPVH